MYNVLKINKLLADHKYIFRSKAVDVINGINCIVELNL